MPEVRNRPANPTPERPARNGAHIYHDMNEGLRDVDVVIMLRLQRERMTGALLPSEGEGAIQTLRPVARQTQTRQARLHRHASGRSIAASKSLSDVADGPQTVILPQVSFGIAVRMAVMAILAGGKSMSTAAHRIDH